MKKIYLSLAAVAVLVLSSCGGGNTPSDVTEAYLKAADKCDKEKLLDLKGDENGDALSDAKKETELKEATLDKIEILDEKIEENDGKETAKVKYKRTMKNGDTDEGTMYLKKGKDGKWRI